MQVLQLADFPEKRELVALGTVMAVKKAGFMLELQLSHVAELSNLQQQARQPPVEVTVGAATVHARSKPRESQEGGGGGGSL